MAHQIRHLIALCALLFVVPWTLAQRPGQLAIRFTVFAAKPIEGLAYLSTTGAALPLNFNPFARSTRHTYNGTSPVKFVDAATKAVVAEAVVPPDIREPLFLFSELPAGQARGLRYQVAVLDDSPTKVPVGHFVILNLSGLKLTGTLDQTALTIEEGSNAPVPLAKAATLRLFASARGTRVQSYADTLKPAKAKRLLLILLPPARKGALEVQSRALVD
jgi:hypothetical protein